MTSAEDPSVHSDQDMRGLRERLASQAEDAIAKLADELLENPLFNSALANAFAAREKLAQAQQAAMGALNVSSASDLDKLARRLRSVSQRLDEVEDGVEKVRIRMEAISDSGKLTEQLERVESRVDEVARELSSLRAQLSATDTSSTTVPEG